MNVLCTEISESCTFKYLFGAWKTIYILIQHDIKVILIVILQSILVLINIDNYVKKLSFKLFHPLLLTDCSYGYKCSGEKYYLDLFILQ